MNTATTHDHPFGMELTAIERLLEDVRGRSGHVEDDTVCSLCRTIRQLKDAIGAHLAIEERVLSPFSWIAESGTKSDLQPLLDQLAEGQVEIRLLLDRIRSLANRYPASQHLNPVLRVALWNLRSLALRLERHLAAANARLLSVARTFNRATRRLS